MTNEEFRCWINGYAILSSEQNFSSKQYLIIRNHANLVIVVSNALDADVGLFLSRLEAKFKTNDSIPFIEFQNHVMDMGKPIPESH